MIQASRPPRPLLPLGPLLAALAVLLLHPGCGNPACVFGGDCSGTGAGPSGALGTFATFPDDNQWIVDGEPFITDLLPTSDDPVPVVASTPIVMIFSESMSPDSLDGAFEITALADGFGGGGFPVIASLNLVGDGRVLIMLPVTSLPTALTYEVTLAEDAVVRDITGQLLDANPGDLLGSFVVTSDEIATPRVVATYPANTDANQSETTPIVVAFDRPMDASTVTADSFRVLLDGFDPAFDPDPEPLSLSGLIPIDDTRVFLWQQVDDAGVVVPITDTTEAEVTLSAGGLEILPLEGLPLPEEVFDFRFASFRPPLSAAITSNPAEAIGVPNLTADSGNELAIQVILEDGQPGDRLTAYLFGTDPEDEDVTYSLFRDLILEGEAPIESATFGLADLDLLLSSDPLAPRFADGVVAVAVRLRQGSVQSTVRVLDTDPEREGIQDPVLDTVPPEIIDLYFPGGGADQYRSDVRDLVIAGTASEPVRAVEVVTALGNNGTEPPVAGVNEQGGFIAAPVPLGIVAGADLPLTYELTLFDLALNSNEMPIAGLFEQLGAVGPEPLAAGGPLAVTVYDAHSLEPISSAAVMTHALATGFPLVEATVSDAAGFAAVDAAGAGAAGTLLSVYAAGYERFTYQGPIAGRIGVPLVPTAPPTSSTLGDVSSTNSLVTFLLPLLSRRVGDSRRGPWPAPTFATNDCTGIPIGGGALTCSYGPENIQAGPVGAQSLIAGTYTFTEPISFSPEVVVQTFTYRAPVDPGTAGQPSGADFDVQAVLSDPSVPVADRPVPVQFLTLLGSPGFTPGIDFDDLLDDPSFTGEPVVAVEALVPGVRGAVPVGLGVAFQETDTLWSLRAAYAGSVVGEGSLAQVGAVDPDLRVRAEFGDSAGNRAGQRPRLSGIESLPLAGILVPPGAVQLLDPVPGGAASGPSYTLTFSNALADGQAQEGLYRITLVDSQGERWQLWQADLADAFGPLGVRVPDISQGGGVGLADGEIQFSATLVAWPGFDQGAFLWSDLEREYDAFSVSAPVTYSQE